MGQRRTYVKACTSSELGYQDKLARFLENHDEPRAATFTTEVHQAAAVITFLSPGLRSFHQGQFQGCRKRIWLRFVALLDWFPASVVDRVIIDCHRHYGRTSTKRVDPGMCHCVPTNIPVPLREPCGFPIVTFPFSAGRQ